jgi:hypothetical protein
MAFIEPKKWASWLPTAKWLYNFSYHTTIKMSPFEALYEYPPPSVSALPVDPTLSSEAQATLTEKDHMIKVLQ